MGVKRRTEYRLTPMPMKGTLKRGGGGGTYVDENDKVLDIDGVEALLNGMHAEGWNPALLPLDLYQPALLFTRSHEVPDDERIETILERMDSIDTWAPECGIDKDLLHVVLVDNRKDAELIIRAVLAVS
jgi:hypothetical protein